VRIISKAAITEFSEKCEFMNATLIDEHKYQRLLGEALPVVIRTEQEYQRLLNITEQLMGKPEEQITEEEGRLLELLSVLVEEYEDRMHPLPKAKPHKLLAYLLEERGMKPSDLWTAQKPGVGDPERKTQHQQVTG